MQNKDGLEGDKLLLRWYKDKARAMCQRMVPAHYDSLYWLQWTEIHKN